jgi:hypothetical protein
MHVCMLGMSQCGILCSCHEYNQPKFMNISTKNLVVEYQKMYSEFNPLSVSLYGLVMLKIAI